MIQFHCSRCSDAFVVDDRMAGTQARCNRCGTILTVPYPSSGPMPVEPARPQPSQPLAPTAGPNQADGAAARREIPVAVWIVCAVGGGIAVLVLLAMLARSFLSSARPDTTAPRPTADSSSSPDVSHAPDGPTRQGFPIPFERSRTAVTAGPPGCPIVIVDRDVWNLEQNRVVQHLQGTYDDDTMRALSANGEWFAVGVKASSRTEPSITIWHTPTGKIQWGIPSRPVKNSQILTLTRDKYLLIAGPAAGQVEVWDVATGELMMPIQTPRERLRRSDIAFAPGGESFATKDERGKRVLLFSTQTGQQIAEMDPPLEMDVHSQPPAGNDNGPRPARKPAPDRAVFVYAHLQALEFSPDGQALAALSTHPRLRLLCWNTDGKLLFDEPVRGFSGRLGASEHSIQWLLDGKGWLLSGNIFDRESKRVVLKVRQRFGYDPIVHMIDEKRLLGVFGDSKEIALVEVPWDRLRQSLKLIEDGAPAIVTPNQPVSLQVELGSLRGGAEETRSRLTNALTSRLARDGVRVKAGQETVFRLRFAEQAGQTLPIYERQSLSNPRSRDTGRTATEVKGTVVVELMTSGRETPMWRESLKATSSRGFLFQEINDATMRDSMISSLTSRIHKLDFPYFMPLADEHLALPVIVE